MSEVMVKAVPVNGLSEFVSKELQPSQVQAVLSQLPPEQARYFSGHLLAHEQVPLPLVNNFTRLAAKEKGEPVKKFAHRAGRYGAELGLKSVYKFIMMIMSIDAVLRKAPLMWSRVYDTGKMTVESGSNRAKIHIDDFLADPAGCSRITGWFEVIGERAGAKDMRVVHSRCKAEGGTECLWEFEWKD